MTIGYAVWWALVGGHLVTAAVKVRNMGWHSHERAEGMPSTIGNGCTMIVTLTLTSPSRFLLLPTGGSGMCFSFVLGPAGSVGCCINVEVMVGWRGLLLARGVYGGSFVWLAAPISLYSFRFAPNFGRYSVSFGTLAPGGGTCWRYMLRWISFGVARQPVPFGWLVSDGTWKATKHV